MEDLSLIVPSFALRHARSFVLCVLVLCFLALLTALSSEGTQYKTVRTVCKRKREMLVLPNQCQGRKLAADKATTDQKTHDRLSVVSFSTNAHKYTMNEHDGVFVELI